MIRLALSTLAGASLGLAWYLLIGCRTGTCPMSSTWWLITGWGAVTGFAVAWPHRHGIRPPGGAPWGNTG